MNLLGSGGKPLNPDQSKHNLDILIKDNENEVEEDKLDGLLGDF